MTTLEGAAAAIDRAGHLGVVSTTRADGSVQSTVVTAGIIAHPVSGAQTVAFTSAGTSAKLRFLRRRPQATIVFQPDFHWTAVEGTADLVGYDDPREGVDAAALRRLLRDVFTAAGGTHEDWDAYDRAMAEERRSAVLIRPTRILGM
ncbi:TIGR03618 family F420-dependent PPOX class oxidoreductase [Streptomonospora litoralis]|uniref:Pyridoxine/pyridoxamine 5'-phosphate oxidase n=1 Tax=Streptomonospora litoralis TaxID=2498135 RepID=A0A4P6Q1K8_9ACTN|nr:TIGR03618 family F420-dependent PPOX class oxidoreductase [Streptomonospora litoralis]QBI54468.1 Putative pyridoxine/pyridoxamine 5'-phosphate oxidase [Streptomonospora litoralis]